jgi:hypothetical protein
MLETHNKNERLFLIKKSNLKVRHPRYVFESDVWDMQTSNTTMSSMLSIY